MVPYSCIVFICCHSLWYFHSKILFTGSYSKRPTALSSILLIHILSLKKFTEKLLKTPKNFTCWILLEIGKMSTLLDAQITQSALEIYNILKNKRPKNMNTKLGKAHKMLADIFDKHVIITGIQSPLFFNQNFS